MIRINLLPAEESQRAEGRRQDLASIALAVGGATLLLVIAHTWQQAQFASANREIVRLQQELTAVQGNYMDVTRMETQKKELQERLRVIGELERRKSGPAHVLEALSNATPEKLWLTEFSETGGMLKITGLGVDEQTVADFLRSLGASPFYRNVDLDETSMVDQDGIKHKKFSIRAAVNYLDTATAEKDTAKADKTDPLAPARDAAAPAPRQEGEQ